MIHVLPASIPAAEVRRLLGYPAGFAIPARVSARLEECLAQAAPLVEARGGWEPMPLSEAASVDLPLPGPQSALGGFALGLATIGPGIEERLTAATRDGDVTGALLLDAIGSAAAEAAADALGRLIVAQTERMAGPPAGPEGHFVAMTAAVGDMGEVEGTAGIPGVALSDSPCRVSPGYGDWPLPAQAALFARLPHAELGVRLLSSMLMVPKKSVTFAIWFDPAGRAVTGPGGCSRCALERCPRRGTGLEGVPA